MNTLELIICSVTLPSSAVCRSDSNGPQKASFCSAAPLSMCWQRSVGPMDWYCGPWSTKKSLEIKGWHTEENRLFYRRRTCSDKTRTVKVWWHYEEKLLICCLPSHRWDVSSGYTTALRYWPAATSHLTRPYSLLSIPLPPDHTALAGKLPIDKDIDTS